MSTGLCRGGKTVHKPIPTRFPRAQNAATFVPVNDAWTHCTTVFHSSQCCCRCRLPLRLKPFSRTTGRRRVPIIVRMIPSGCTHEHSSRILFRFMSTRILPLNALMRYGISSSAKSFWGSCGIEIVRDILIYYVLSIYHICDSQ